MGEEDHRFAVIEARAQERFSGRDVAGATVELAIAPEGRRGRPGERWSFASSGAWQEDDVEDDEGSNDGGRTGHWLLVMGSGHGVQGTTAVRSATRVETKAVAW
jgi:hypothetical protein